MAAAVPVHTIIVNNDENEIRLLLSAVSEPCIRTASYNDPLTALEALERDSDPVILVTRVDFGRGKLNGLALSRMLRFKRRALGVVFVGRAEEQAWTDGEGEFVPYPLDPRAVLEAVDRSLKIKRG